MSFITTRLCVVRGKVMFIPGNVRLSTGRGCTYLGRREVPTLAVDGGVPTLAGEGTYLNGRYLPWTGGGYLP